MYIGMVERRLIKWDNICHFMAEKTSGKNFIFVFLDKMSGLNKNEASVETNQSNDLELDHEDNQKITISPMIVTTSDC